MFNRNLNFNNIVFKVFKFTSNLHTSNLKFKPRLLLTFCYRNLYFNGPKSNFSCSLLFHKMADHNKSISSDIFVGKIDGYKGVNVKSVEEPCDAARFLQKLETSMKKWISEKMRAAWFFVSLEQADWVPVLVKNGFRFHHTQPGGEVVTLVRWLADEESRIPPFAHTMIGAGAIVVNSEGQLLVVQERYRDIVYWKLPGGYVEPGEDITEAAMREVLEETNIRTEFRSLIAFRHSHQAPFGCSDIYFVVELSPLTTDIAKDELEVEDCQWMDIETFMNHPSVHKLNRLLLRKYLFSKERGITVAGMKVAHPITKASQMVYCLESTDELEAKL